MPVDPELPFMQVQPVNRELYGNALEQFELVTDLAHLRPEEWNAFQTTVVRPNVDPHRQQGQYAVAARRRRKQELFDSPASDTAADDNV